MLKITVKCCEGPEPNSTSRPDSMSRIFSPKNEEISIKFQVNWLRRLTNEKEGENNHQHVYGLADNVLYHGARNEGFSAAVRFALEQIGSWHFGGQSQRSQSVHDQVDPEHLDSLERRVLDETSADEGHSHGHDVDSQLELQELGDRVVDVTAPHDCLDDAVEVVVRQDNVGRFFGHVRSGDALINNSN